MAGKNACGERKGSWRPPSAPALKALRGFAGRPGHRLKFSVGANIYVCRRGAKLPGERGTWCFGIELKSGRSGFFPENCVSGEDLFDYNLAIKQAFVEYKNHYRLKRRKVKGDNTLNECLSNVTRGCTFSGSFLEAFRGTLIIEVGSLDSIKVNSVGDVPKRAKVLIWIGKCADRCENSVRQTTAVAYALPSGDDVRFVWNEALSVPLGADSGYVEMVENALCAGQGIIVGCQIISSSIMSGDASWETLGPPTWTHVTHLVRYSDQWIRAAVFTHGKEQLSIRMRFKHSKRFGPVKGLPLTHPAFVGDADYEVSVGEAFALTLKNGRQPQKCSCRLKSVLWDSGCSNGPSQKDQRPVRYVS